MFFSPVRQLFEYNLRSRSTSVNGCENERNVRHVDVQWCRECMHSAIHQYQVFGVIRSQLRQLCYSVTHRWTRIPNRAVACEFFIESCACVNVKAITFVAIRKKRIDESTNEGDRFILLKNNLCVCTKVSLDQWILLRCEMVFDRSSVEFNSNRELSLDRRGLVGSTQESIILPIAWDD